jgi:DNA polymerase I-like protein with 3'-5' exonuclease and polymerase domains
VQQTMENVVNFAIPLPVTSKIGKNWGEVH